MTAPWQDFPNCAAAPTNGALKLISIRDLIAFRLNHDSLVEIGEEVDMPTIYGHFRLIPFRQKDNNLEHIAPYQG